MDKKTEKKIKNYQENSLSYLDDIINKTKELHNESNDKKKLKLEKKIRGYRDMVSFLQNELEKLGSSFDIVKEEANEEQLKIINELFPTGTDANSVEIDKIIDYVHRCRIDRVINLEEKGMTYDTNASMEEKTKNRLYNAYLDIGSYMDETGNGKPDSKWYPYYNEYWQYDRDYEATKDKYFTKEEQEIISKSMDIYYKEYVPWFKENHKTRMAIGKAISDAGQKIGEFGDITQAQVWSGNLFNEVFPQVVKEIHPEYDKSEIKEESKEMTKRYIKFLTSKEDLAKAMEEKAKLKVEVENIVSEFNSTGRVEGGGIIGSIFNQKLDNLQADVEGNRYAFLYELMRENLGKERAAFIALYDKDSIIEEKTELLSKYSFEDLGLE